jgi:hypothetical protein
MKQYKNEPPPRPADPEEAKQWLRALVCHLSDFPHASRRLRFIAYAIDEFLSGRQTLSKALGLTVKKNNPKRGRPATPPETVTRIALMLRKNARVSSIAKAIGVSKDTVETIRAEMHKATKAVPDYERDQDRDIRPNEWNRAEERAKEVMPERKKAIFAGMAENIELHDLIDTPGPSEISSGRPGAPRHKTHSVPRKSK